MRIGSLGQTLSLRLPPVLQQYAVRYPAVALTVTSGNSADLIKQVLDQSLDGAFVRGPVGQPGLRAEPIFRETLVLVTGLSTPTMEELRQAADTKAIVLAQGCSYRELLTGILEDHGIKHQVLSLESLDAMRTLVQSNVGVALLHKEMLAALWKDSPVAIHELPEGSAQVETVFICRTDRPKSSALEAFLSLSRASSNITT